MPLPRRHLPACAAFVAALLLPGAAAAQSPNAPQFTIDDIVISLDSQPTSAASHGYSAYEFIVSNRSATTPHQVTLKISQQYNRSYLRGISRGVQVNPLSSARVVLWRPTLYLEGYNLEVAIDGKVRSRPGGGDLHLNFYGQSYNQRTLMVLWSMSARDHFRQFHNWPGPGSGGTPTLPSRPGALEEANWTNASGQPTDAWSPNWLSYSGYDGVIITSQELRGLPAEVRTAVWRYVECGGSLLIVGRWPVPEGWKARQTTVGSLAGYSVGFGECLVTADPDYQRWPPQQWRYIVESWTMTAGPFRAGLSAAEAHDALPVVDHVDVPVRNLFLLMLGFVLVIGPVNLYVLSKKKRRIWLLATVPLIALVTCLTVTAYMVLNEGWGVHERSESVTFLDEASGRAATLSWLGMYATASPPGGLHFSNQTELSPLWHADPYNNRGSYAVRTVDWTTDQHLSPGWLPPRVPVHFLVRKSVNRKERLTVQKDAAGKLIVVNGLPGPLSVVHVADRSGAIYTARDVPAGGQAPLQPAGSVRPAAQRKSLRHLYWTNWLTEGRALSEDPAAYLLPGCYVATLDGKAFLDEGLQDASESRGRSVVYGAMKEP
jgi:hypothetical protein